MRRAFAYALIGLLAALAFGCRRVEESNNAEWQHLDDWCRGALSLAATKADSLRILSSAVGEITREGRWCLANLGRDLRVADSARRAAPAALAQVRP